MLQILVPGTELWNETTEEFIPETKDKIISVEHSLVSLSKWETRWNKPFLSEKKMTKKEMVDYIRCMTLTQNVEPELYYRITNKNIEEVKRYMKLPMTAAVFHEEDKPSSKREFISAESIYYMMIVNNIPFDPCQKWHLNRLFALIRYCNIKNDPKKKKIPPNKVMQNNTALNAARRKAWNTTG